MKCYDRIYVEQAVPMVNQVNLWIRGNGHVWGARNVEFIEFSYCNRSDLKILNISGDLGETAIWGLDRVGSVHLGGDLLTGLSASEYIYSTITVDGTLRGGIAAPSMGGLQVLGNGPHAGNITLQQSYAYAIAITGDYAGDMSFLQNVSGEVEVMDGLSGSIVVANNLTGRIVVRHDVTADGLIAAEGDANGFIIAGHVLAGQVRVNGSLLNGPEVNDIWIGTGLDATGAIAIDYDGWEASDTRAPGAVVRVGASTYTRNTPAARVYEITECKGDMNNDELVDFGDINPFVLALSNPAGFGDAHPGLDGSMVYHGDLSCDDLFDFADVNPFVLRLAQGCCEPTCGDCPGFGLAAPPPPAKLAATLKAHTAPKLHDALLDIVAKTPLWQSDPAQRKYWEGVYDELVK